VNFMEHLDSKFWRGRRVLITGHTGFKGGWLAHWLETLGADIHGVALPPTTSPALYEVARPNLALGETIADISVEGVLDNIFASVKPDIVIHLAAQALVHSSYKAPINTYFSNVVGTLRVLEACRLTYRPRAVLIITTDKVYRNADQGLAFSESDALGGNDPYSASKACCEIIVESYRKSFFHVGNINIGVARAGNVIGGGDWSEDRLIPDALRAFAKGENVILRNPDATRPWQHVLEALNGYLIFSHALLTGASCIPTEINFGPSPEDFLRVKDVIEHFAANFAPGLGWVAGCKSNYKEAKYLVLSSDLAHQTLGWLPKLNAEKAIIWTSEWYREFEHGVDCGYLVRRQINNYTNILTCGRDC